MHQTELARIAAFKLHEAARRMLTLARSAESTALRNRLERLSRRLAAEAERLQCLAAAVDAAPARLRQKRSPSRRAA